MTTRYAIDTIARNGQVPNLPSSVKLPGIGTVPISLKFGYVNGLYYWHSIFPDAWIDVNGSDPKADILDVEKGDATPDRCPTWAKDHNKAGTDFPAVIYCNRSNLTPVFNAMDAAGLHIARDFYTFVSTLDGTLRLPDMTGVVAVQAFGAAQLGFNADVSLVYNDNFKPHKGYFVHTTTGHESIGQISASRNMAPAAWIAEQFKLNNNDAERLLSDAIPPAGLTWLSTNP